MGEIEKRYTLNERTEITVCRNNGGALSITLNMNGAEQRSKRKGILKEGNRYIGFGKIYFWVKNKHFKMILCMFLDILRIMISRSNITISQLVLTLERMLLM